MANSMTVTGTPIAPTVADDPLLCRISGYLKDIQGRPLKGYGVTLRHIYSPLGIAPQTLILQERINVKTDGSGFLQFDLLRGARVDVEVPNRLIDHVHHCLVPDADSCDLVDFLTPYLVSADWASPGDEDVALGDNLELLLTGVLSNGEVIDIPSCAVTLTSADGSIVQVLSSTTVHGAAVGTAEVTPFIDVSQLGLLTATGGGTITLLSVPDLEQPAAKTVTVS